MLNRSTIVCAGLMIGSLAWLVSAAVAGDGDSVVLPNTMLPKHGLKLSIDTTWVNAAGYRPVHLELRTDTGAPSQSERRLNVRITPSTGQGSSKHYSGEIILPSGQASAINHLLIPQTSVWYAISIETFEQGEHLEDLSTNFVQVNRNASSIDSEPKVLVIDPNAPILTTRSAARNQGSPARSMPGGTFKLPDLRGLAHFVNNSNYWGDPAQPIDDGSTIAMVEQLSNLELLPPAQLPDRWIGYSSLDVIFVSLTEALALRQQETAQWESLKQWAAAGGNLVVYGVGRDYQQLARLEAALGHQGRSLGPPLDRWLRGGDAKSDGAALRQLADQEWAITQRRLANPGAGSLAKTAEELEVLRLQWQSETIGDPAWFPMRFIEYGHGKVVAMPEANPFPGGNLKWQWLEDTIKPYSSWSERAGINPESGDRRYYEHLIPGVGLPPVDTFRLLITLFVIVIGPVNYLLLKNRKRLFLLLVTVPVGAAVVTVSLFGYALIKDGLSVRTRVQSYTALDQQAGLASSWSRQTYFASLPPSRGLTFPGTAAIQAIFPSDGRARWAHSRSHGTWLWEGDTQRLARGYLSSRTTSEYLVANSEAIGETNLQFSRQGAGNPPQVTNHLGVVVDHLLVVDYDGASYWLADLKPDQTVTLEPYSMAEATAKLRDLAKANRDIDPLEGQRGRGLFWDSRNPDHTSTIGPGMLGTGRYSVLNAVPGSNEALQGGEFLAILSQSPEFVPLGASSSKESASFHVIKGRFLIQ